MYNPLDFLSFLASGANPLDCRGKEIGHDEFESHSRSIFIDTCFTMDTGSYETAIKVDDDPLIIVEEYNTEEEAESGHRHWVKICSRPKFSLSNIQIPEVRIYE